MAKANCGGLMLSSDTLIVKNNIITTIDGSPTGGVKANCGGIQFDDTLFKKVGKVITGIDADPEAVEGFIVNQPGCGGVLLDSNYFEFDEDGNITFESGPSAYNLTRSARGCEVVVLRDGTPIADGRKVLNIGDTITISLVPGLYAVDSFKVNGVDFEDGDSFIVDSNVSIVVEAHAVDYFKLVAVDPNVTISIEKAGYGEISANFEYYIEGSRWKDFELNTTSVLLENAGDVVYFRAKGINASLGNSSARCRFVSNNRFLADGSVMTLLDKYLSITSVPAYGFYGLFENSHITEAYNILPSMGLGESCYASMFYGCNDLILPPLLPADVLAKQCYMNMFGSCAQLIRFPSLMARTLAEGCYSGMFQSCPGIVESPDFSNAITAPGCYQGMFYHCANLTRINGLPSINLANNCYESMFEGCTGLTSVPQLPAITVSEGAYKHMFKDCTSLTTVGNIDATVYGREACNGMFLGCTSLTTPPILKEATLGERCYQFMFSGCTSLQIAPILSTATLAARCYESMFQGCTSLTQAPELPAMTLADGCYTYMFNNCTALVQAPVLPATTLANSCYYAMFYGCTSLTRPPELPAEDIPYEAYKIMFNGCSGIKVSETQTGDYTISYRIPTSGTGTVGSGALDFMFISTGGTFTGTPTVNTTYYLPSNFI